MQAGARPSDAAPETPRDDELAQFKKGAWVWSPCTRMGFRRSQIVSVDTRRDSFFVESREQDPADGGQSQQTVRRSEVRPCYDVAPGRTFQDNTEMVHLDDANILENLRRRYQKEEIYTYTANVLLAVNPYKSLSGLYGMEQIEKYKGRGQGILPPHPYAIADVAYRQLQRDRKNQALVISGESGAGKTETAKKTMHYLTNISRTDAAQGSRIQDKIVNANPILESFGNATTVMNDNSSRFGKYNEMMFNPVGSLVGAGIKTFLLESSRVVSQQSGEKNYHVFYELLAGMDEQVLMERLMLDRNGSYKLLHSAGAQPLQEGSSECLRLTSKFKDLKQALSTFADEKVQDSIWDIVGALVHLGEVDFVETGVAAMSDSENASLGADASPCSSSPGSGSAALQEMKSQEARVEVDPAGIGSLETAADLLGLAYSGLTKVLKWKEMHVTRAGRVSHIQCPRSLAQARQTLQCVIKILYKRLFSKIVTKINEVSNALAGKDTTLAEHTYNSIGTLDIYGFERLHTNSFEQLCINLANERLQQFFVEEVLEAEQRMYYEEALDVPSMDLPDSAPVVFGIKSIMSKLDDHSVRAGKNLVRTGPGEDKDTKFCEQVHRELIKDPKQSGPIMALRLKANRSVSGPGLNDGFQICHYAGCVSYSTKGWIDKNNDYLVPEIEALLADGKKDMVKEMADSKGMAALSGERPRSVSSNYLTNLDDLLSTLKKCSVHYIRCFNPNKNRQAGVFNGQYVLDQVVQCGTVELVKIMHHGFPHRCLLRDLRDRFKDLLPPDFARYSDRDFVHAVMLAWKIHESQWTLGTKRLFLKAGQLRVLEDLRDLGRQASKEVIKKIRQQFNMKKARAYAHAVEFVTYVQRVVRKGKRERVFQSFMKAMHNYVRICRWLGKVRKNLYGAPPEDYRLTAEALLHLKRGLLPFHLATYMPKCVDLKVTTEPKIFVALNSVDMQGNLDRMWHGDASESILYFDGSAVKCAQLNSSAFRRRGDFAKDGSLEEPVQDVRQVDCMQTGQAFALSARPQPDNSIVAMCQNPDDEQVFATCDSQNAILVWKWLGTRFDAPRRPCLRPEAYFSYRRSRQVIQLCFLASSQVPQHVAEQGGYVLIVLSKGQEGLQIGIHAIIKGLVSTDCEEIVHLDTDVLSLQSFRDHGVHISYFGMSHSNTALILAGRHILRLFCVGLDESGQLSLHQLDANEEGVPSGLMRSDSARAGGGTVVSVCPMPCQPVSDESFADWVWLGMSSGELIGLLIQNWEGDVRVNSNHSGRWPRATHSKGQAIRAVVPTYMPQEGSPKSSSHAMLTHKAPLNPDMAVSIGADGKLLTCAKGERHRWDVVAESVIPGFQGALAAQSSCLESGVLVVAIASPYHQCLLVLNRESPGDQPDRFECSLL
eukprot:TRINITY_DN304_c0_g4_i3.p1 TRINITY_DN304_c0_g4~~TRINITY_DN304_c0_g4_i3.p1  ORF type:complete len:1396 (+),score=270.35 TRINITY_DN304_c0_g4_i3:95-4282(+)